MGLAMVRAERRITHMLDKRVMDGAQLRSAPPIELPWVTTFNLRWWCHLADMDSQRTVAKPAGKVGLPD